MLPISFAGGLLDRDTGLIHFAYREYDPTTGMFIQSDPLGHAAGDVHTYGWCLDDPVNLVDPLGLDIRVRSAEGMPGHVWMSVDGGPFVGFYPAEGNKGTGGDGEWRDDTDRPYDKETYIATRKGSGQDEAAKAALKQTMEHPGGYNFWDKNCVVNVDAILKKAGIATPNEAEATFPSKYHRTLENKLTGRTRDWKSRPTPSIF